MQSPTPPIESPGQQPSRIRIFCIIAGCSILFCSKGIFAKMAYRYGVDALTVLTLRMAFALPFFVGIVIASREGAARLGFRDWAELAGLAFLGYYVSSLVNFTGLQYVSVGLERIILYTYPTLVLAASAVVFRKRVRPVVWFACLMAWVGIAAAFVGEGQNPVPSGKTGLGAALVFASALSYAFFLMLSGRTIQRVGPMRFTGIVVGCSCLFMLLHYASRWPIATLAQLPAPVYVHGAILGLFGTVAPAVLMSLDSSNLESCCI